MPMYGSESTAAPKPAFDMDNEAESQFCRFVEKMPAKADGTVRLFDRGDYFSAHGPDALLIAHEVYKTTNVLKYLGARSSTKGLPSVTLRSNLTKNFLRECLTAKQMRVEIYEPEEGAAGRKNNARWVLAKTASPGNISQVENLLFADSDMVSNAVSMAIKISDKEGMRTVGCAVIDVQEKMMRVSEFVDDENFGNTESLLIQLGVKECLLQANEKGTDQELAKLGTVLDRCGVIVTERKAEADFVAKNIDQDLDRLLDGSSAGAARPEFDLKSAMSAVAALLIYLSLLSDATLHGEFQLAKHDLSQFMRLDASALRALSLFPSPQDTGGAKSMSVFGLLDQCKTSQGKRLLGRWLKQPLVNLHEIVKRQNVVEIFFDDAMTRRSIQTDVLNVMPDFHRLSKKFHRRAASLDDVVRVYQAVRKLPMLITYLRSLEPYNAQGKELLEEVYIIALEDLLDKLEKYQDLVEETVDLDLSSHGSILKADLDEDLLSLRNQLNSVVNQLDSEHKRVGNDLGLDIEKKLHLENHQTYKYCLRVTKAEASAIRNQREYIEYSTQKAGTYFTTKKLKALSEEYETLNTEYAKKQKSLERDVIQIAGATYTSVMEKLDNVIAAIDVPISLAQVASAATIPYVRPSMTERGHGDLVVKGARHPCLEQQVDMSFIANDHEMRKSDSEFIILTGPNMGGKSTYIRQIGVIALLAQIGAYVPADEATLPIFDCILARVGAGDSQLKGVSTFMAEMLETATILKAATPNSLIIIDELGRGTSTYDGFGLAWAISEHIASKIRCFCLFATHFHELTTMDQNLPHVKNMHVVAHVKPRAGNEGSKTENEITLLYKVEEGVCDQSFGIHVAELAAFPDSVVKLAKRKAEELEDFGDGEHETALTKFSKTETHEGVSLVKDFLDTWKSRTGTTSQMSEEEQVDQLRQVAKEYRDRFEGSPWVKELLQSF